MAVTAVFGASPVSFVSEDTAGSDIGVEYQVPLSALAITATGTVDRTAWTAPSALTSTDLTNLDALLKDLLARGVIWPKPSS